MKRPSHPGAGVTGPAGTPMPEQFSLGPADVDGASQAGQFIATFLTDHAWRGRGTFACGDSAAASVLIEPSWASYADASLMRRHQKRLL